MPQNMLIPYTHDGIELEGFASYPKEGKHPLVILCHAWRGRDEFICEKAKLISSLGFASFAVDMYGKGVLGQTKEENTALKKPFILNRLLLRNRLLQGYNKACNLPFVDATRIAVLGFGFGGICALDLARTGLNLKGAISVYGHFESPSSVPIQPIKTKILILHGFNDPVEPISELQKFQQQLELDQVDWQTHLYGNTYHAFATPSANEIASGLLYNPISAKRAWTQIENFLAEVLF